MWVAAHRKHHVFSDTEHDPHSPRDGGWWATCCGSRRISQKGSETASHRYAPDLHKDPMMRFLDKTFFSWPRCWRPAVAVGYFGWDAYTGMSFLVVWGIFVRMVFVLHVTWFVNSASHMWGYRNYETTDDSRNCGGSACWPSAKAGTTTITPISGWPGTATWWEIDMTYWAIWLEKLGLAWNVVKEVPSRQRELQK